MLLSLIKTMIWKDTSRFVLESQQQISVLTRSLIIVIQANGGRSRSPQFILSHSLTDKGIAPRHAGNVSRHSGLMVLESEMSYPYSVLTMRNRFENNNIAKKRSLLNETQRCLIAIKLSLRFSTLLAKSNKISS